VHKSIATIILASTLALSLAACGVVSALVDGAKYAHAAETDLEAATGTRPAVGFNWNNGHLASVTVTFPGLYEAKPIGELANSVRAAVTKEFKETPKNIVLAFNLGATPGRTADAGQAALSSAH
jgi:hypothetical protein